MTPDSARRLFSSTQGSVATRPDPFTEIAGRVEARVDSVRRALINGAERGFAVELSEVMRWRTERRSRELNGVEKLSLADVVAEVELHRANGEDKAAEAILSALTEGLRPAGIPLRPGTVLRICDEKGQMFLGFDRRQGSDR